MIRVQSIKITEFRGIRDLTLNLNGNCFAICGPNGTGKSGIVDALEFALTGNISRLSGEGKGDVSLKKHGPHVDKRNDPDKARVLLEVTIPSLDKTITIERNLADPSNAHVTPSDPNVLEVLRQVKSHSEIILSRRELIRYVLATPGKRAEEVQALLHLDQVEQVRANLQKIANSCKKQLAPLKGSVSLTQDNLLRALEISELTPNKILTAANANRAILGLPPLSELSSTTSLKDGISTQVPSRATRIPKAQAIEDIKAARNALSEVSSSHTDKQVNEIRVELKDLSVDPLVEEGFKRENFYTTGMEIIEDASCPFCDTTWEPNALKKHVQAKIDALKETSRKRTAVERKIVPLIDILRRAQSAIEIIVRHASLSETPLAMENASEYSRYCISAIDKLTAFIPLSDTIKTINSLAEVPKSTLTAIDTFEKIVIQLPEPTKKDAAREWLTLSQERLEVWREALRKEKIAKEQAQSAQHVSEIYAETSDKVLTDIYANVEKHFAMLYRFANSDDEDKFDAKLVPSMGKLGFNVDFYGRGFFPPGAYHSEGHQDSMGLCLYLALMRHLLGSRFTFAVLDDVLMSVDAGHRRKVCSLFKSEFPNTQFVMTTHDQVWLRHMRTEGMIKSRSSVQFRNWDVEIGPTRWHERDTWTEIYAHLEENNVRDAASLLRHYLEYVAAELCHRLRAPVEFRGDAQYQLGELLPAAIKHMRNLYSRAKAVANSWNQKDIIEQISSQAAVFASLAETSLVEQWQVNAAVHFNSWDNLRKEDFEPVVNAFKELLSGFVCPECSEYIRVLPDRETPKLVRCGCGKFDMNLVKKNTS